MIFQKEHLYFILFHLIKSISSDDISSHFQAMGDLAAEGGKIFWVAPSGGRDRPDAATGEYVVAPFDGKALDMFKLVCMQSRKVRDGSWLHQLVRERR